MSWRTASKTISNNLTSCSSKTPLITYTRPALQKLMDISNNNNYVYFGTKGTGCNGLQYYLNPSSKKPKPYDEVVSISKRFDIIIPNSSLLHVIGTEIGWTTDIMGSRFTFENPNAASKCGCGSSFNTRNTKELY
jgi:iron-sulfur cluster assembly protein